MLFLKQNKKGKSNSLKRKHYENRKSKISRKPEQVTG